jgi:pyruvate formate-lyase activating enzyme-like uncharacterized protein
MKIIPIQEAYRRKFERQKKIEGLEYHAAGHCVHVGKLSPGCESCFIPDPLKDNICVGVKCNLDCPYCFDRLSREPDREERIKIKAAHLRNSLLPTYDPRTVSFSGGGEPLMYMDVLTEYMTFFNDVDKDAGKKPWYHLYTNGIHANDLVLSQLRDLGIDEIRFHLGASNFSKKAYDNLARARHYFQALTVETPAWPPHRKKLFEMLPILEDIGVNHVNMGEIEITPFNHERIASRLSYAEVYQAHEMHLDDGGLVYDLIDEVSKKGYSFSVLDCNCFVKSMQRGPAKYVRHEDVAEIIARYPDPASSEYKTTMSSRTKERME